MESGGHVSNGVSHTQTNNDNPFGWISHGKVVSDIYIYLVNLEIKNKTKINKSLNDGVEED